MKRLFAVMSFPAGVSLFILGLMFMIVLSSCGKNKVTGEDTTPPTVQILSPDNKSEVSDTVEIRVEAKDNIKVDSVQFYINSQLFFTDTQSPWEYDWISYLYDDSTTHTIYAVAYDQASNSASSGVITVTVRVSAGFYFIERFNTTMAHDVFVQGDYAYVADGEEGLRIINVENPAFPYSEGHFNTSGFAKAVFVSGSYAYVADGENGLQIVNISIPSTPDSAGWFNTPGSGEDVFVSGNFAYLADGGEGLQIIDITDPNNPDSAARFSDGSSIKGVFVSGDYAYLSTADKLQILDVSDPTDPGIAGFHYMPFYKGNRIYVEGNYAYIAALGDGLHIFNVSDPYNPVELDTVYNPGGTAYGVFVYDDLAYVAFEVDGVHVIDVSNPYQIGFVDRFDTEGKSYDLFIVGKLIYVADNSSLVILRLSRS